MNVDKSAVAKIPAIFEAMQGADIFALQEADIPVDSLPRFCEAWKKLGYKFFAARPDERRVIRTGLLTSLAASPIALDDRLDATRFAAALIEVPRANGKFLAVEVYGFATDLPATKVLCEELFTCVGMPWISIKDYNATREELWSVFSQGLARDLDADFEASSSLPATCTGHRRIDWAAGHRLWAVKLTHRCGIANHLLLEYHLHQHGPAGDHWLAWQCLGCGGPGGHRSGFPRPLEASRLRCLGSSGRVAGGLELPFGLCGAVRGLSLVSLNLQSCEASGVS